MSFLSYFSLVFLFTTYITNKVDLLGYFLGKLKMEYRKLGNSGLKLSALSLGSWLTVGEKLDNRESMKLLGSAYDLGINFFDTADVYLNGVTEEIIGTAFKTLGWSRDSFCVLSKVCVTTEGFREENKPTRLGLNRKHIVDSCHGSLKRLQVDYLDLYLCHLPDEDTPIEETLWALHNLVQQGKILYWGTSDWSPKQILKAYMIAQRHNLTPPIMEQTEFNMICRHNVEEKYAGLSDEIGLGITAFSPLAKGLLTGKYSNDIPKDSRASLKSCSWLRSRINSHMGKEVLEKIKKIQILASNLEMSSAQLAIAWGLKNQRISSLILGASNVQQLRENVGALKLIEKLTPEVMRNIENILKNHDTYSIGPIHEDENVLKSLN